MSMHRFAIPPSSTIQVVGGGAGNVVVFSSFSPPPGLSAYQIAVKNGFIGGEAEWLVSLSGPAGNPSGSDIDALLEQRLSDLAAAVAIDIADLNQKTAKYEHHQATPEVQWVAQHNLNKIPSITVLDSAGSEVEGDYSYPSLDQTHLQFSSPFGGVAYFK